MLQIIHPWMPVAVFRIRTFVVILITKSSPIQRANARWSDARPQIPSWEKAWHETALKCPRRATKGPPKAPGYLGTDCSQPLTPSQPSSTVGLARVATHWNKLVPCWPQGGLNPSRLVGGAHRSILPLPQRSCAHLCSRSYAPAPAASVRSQGRQGASWLGWGVCKEKGLCNCKLLFS